MKQPFFYTCGFLFAILVSIGARIIVAHPELKYKKGAVIQFTYISTGGLLLKSREEVVSEVKNGDVTTLNIKVTTVDGGKVSEPYWTKKYYDNFHWAQDVAVGMRPSQQAMEGAAISEFSDSLVYPYSMKIGDTLRTAHSYEKMSLKGDFWEYDSFYFNRKVMEHDTIQTPMGKIPTLRIEYKQFSHTKRKHKYTGDLDETEMHYCSVWFSNEYGVVQTEVTDRFGVTKSTLESIK
jgi:hypothetical protein